MFSLTQALLIILLAVPFSARSSYNEFTGSYTITTDALHNKGMIRFYSSVTIDATTISGTGTIKAPTVTITCDSLCAEGRIAGSQWCSIRAKKFSGDGDIEGARVSIICDDFDFTGTLTCEGECAIYTKKMPAASSFKRIGPGRFTVIETNHPVEIFTQEGLVNKVSEIFRSSCLHLREETIDKLIKKTRTDAVLNRYEDTVVLEQIKKNLEENALFHKNLVHIKRDNAALGMLVAQLGATVLGLSLSYALFENRDTIAQKLGLHSRDRFKIPFLGACGGLCSLVPLVFVPSSYNQWRYPMHQERCEKYSLIIEKLDQAIKIKRIPEEKIITL